MRYLQAQSGLVAVRLEQGDEIHASLVALAKELGLSSGFVVSGIGMISNPVLGFLTGHASYARQSLSGNLELLNLSGNIARYNGDHLCHLHVTLAGTDYQAIGGHLFEAVVAVTVEAMIVPFGCAGYMTRELDPDTGLPGLVFGAGWNSLGPEVAPYDEEV
jgi:predicted DNA-binding protein with PD1-like motif